MPGVQNKNVLVTGANRGIGLVTARLFAASGANVCICARTRSSLASAGLRARAARCSRALSIAALETHGLSVRFRTPGQCGVVCGFDQECCVVPHSG